MKLHETGHVLVWPYVNYSALYFTGISLLHIHTKYGAEMHEGGVFSYCTVWEVG